ncbi:DUF58 domain-containing protein [Myxococcota bacterium]
MPNLHHTLDWIRLASLRLRARTVADGVYAGSHRSRRHGSGVEFRGHRAYVPGDDLRWLDRHALMRHDRLLVRQFETETERVLSLVVDASLSMGYRSRQASGSKLEYAALVAAALGWVAASGGDRLALDWLGGSGAAPMSARGGREASDRLVGSLENVQPAGDLSRDGPAVERVLTRVARQTGRGAVVVLLSDLLDLPELTLERLAALAIRGRVVVAVRVLDPVELRFPFSRPVTLQASEGRIRVEADPAHARAGYLQALERVVRLWDVQLTSRRGRLVRASTTDDPVAVVQTTLDAVAGRRV